MEVQYISFLNKQAMYCIYSVLMFCLDMVISDPKHSLDFVQPCDLIEGGL